jgi:hypothetical protein
MILCTVLVLVYFIFSFVSAIVLFGEGRKPNIQFIRASFSVFPNNG